MITGHVEKCRGLMGQRKQRRWMARRRQVQPLKRWLEYRQEHRGHPLGVEVLHLLVNSAEHLGGVTAKEGVGAQRIADPACHVGGT